MPSTRTYFGDPRVLSAAGHLTAARRHVRTPEAIAAAERDVVAARLAAYIERLVASSPLPLTAEQREGLTAALAGSAR